MTSFMAADLPSEDEEDQDFVPDEVDPENVENKKKKGLRNKRIRGAAVAGGDFDLGGEGEEEEEGEQERVRKKQNMEKRQARANDAWDKLNASKSKGGTVVNVESLCQHASKNKKKKKEQAKTEWMRQLGMLTDRTKPVADQKLSASGAAKKVSDEVAAKALAAVKDATASSVLTNQSGMIMIEEKRRFAGKNITVQRQVSKDSKQAEASKKQQNKAGGLDAVLEQIAPTKKVTVMDKSMSDWKQYKDKDEKVLEELELHKKSGGTYLEKKDFLAAADVKAYEKERDARLASDVRNRGRL